MAFQPAWMLYGATGYTGQLLVEWARKAGMTPILGGRDENKLRAIAEPAGLKYRVLNLEQRGDSERALSGIRLLLNAAGPFAITAAPLSNACLLNGVHYLDISGEVADFRALFRLHERAEQSGVMLLPGVGFGVLPTDCLALHVLRRLPRTALMKIGVGSSGGASRGTLHTLLECLRVPGVAREHGELVAAEGKPASWAVEVQGIGKRQLSANPWRGDLFSCGLSNGLPHVETFFEVPWLVRQLIGHPAVFRQGTGARLAHWLVNRAPLGPGAKARARAKSYCIVEAIDEDGRRASSQLIGPDAYDLSAQTALYAVSRVLGGQLKPGFVTPAQLFDTAPLQQIRTWKLLDR